MALDRPSTRTTQGPPATPVSDPKEILRRVRASLRQTSSVAKEATLGISRDIPTIISSIETFDSQEFINTSENFKVWVSSSIVAYEDPIPGDSTEINLLLVLFQLLPTPVVSSSTFSIPISNMASPLTKMERILVARYSPLNLPNPLSAMPTGDYLKYIPIFTREGDFIAEEHLEEFYSYFENINIE